jgi:predicted RNase H-like nuclease
MIVNGNTLPLEVNLSTFSVSMLPATETTIFDIPSNELVYAFKYRWGADTLNVTRSANVISIQGYKYFCQLLDQLLKSTL